MIEKKARYLWMEIEINGFQNGTCAFTKNQVEEEEEENGKTEKIKSLPFVYLSLLIGLVKRAIKI